MKRNLSLDSANMMSTIQLDPKERQLKRLLLDVAEHIDDSQVVLRWAGGWVRDKILGRPSHDIDVAINCMTGELFGNKLRQFCDIPENKEKHGLQKQDIGHLHKIEKNPDKSKQLETATVKIFGLDVDFVNLRTETYAEDSRTPLMDFGTAEEDARRRDATVNALFYNIHTDQVEDFVGGLDDMQAKIIRTPMEPFQTFTDDPLRVLRLIRFASRLGFAIEPSVQEAMGNERVLQALRAKISRERVGVEVEKMLKGKCLTVYAAIGLVRIRHYTHPSQHDRHMTDTCCGLTGEHPLDALRYIDVLGLYHTVFTDPASPDFPKPELRGWSTTYEFLDSLASSPLYQVLATTEEERYLAWILACVVPFSRVPLANPKADPRKVPAPATAAAREGIKAPNRVSDVVKGAVRNREAIVELKDVVLSGTERKDERDLFGMSIRRWDSSGGHWRLQVLFAVLDNVMTSAQATDGQLRPPGKSSRILASDAGRHPR